MEHTDETALETLPDLPSDEHQAAWARLCERMTDCPTRAALRYLLAGYTYREAARAGGLKSHGSIVDAVRQHGLSTIIHRTDRLVNNHRRVALIGTEELIRRGEADGFENESARDVAVLTGISSDKVLAFEKQHEESGNQGAEFFRGLLDRLEKSGTKLSITVEPQPDRLNDEPDPQTVEGAFERDD